MALNPNVFTNNPLLHVHKTSLESTLIEGETLAYGLRSIRTSSSLFTAQDELGKAIGFKRAASTMSSVVADEYFTDKSASKVLLQLNSVPTALGQKMPHRGYSSARRFAERNGWPVVVKPLRGSGGTGVTANISSEEELREAIRHADSSIGFLIEKHVSGEDYRFLVIGDRVEGVWVRDAANVIGDGQSTIDALIDEKNKLRAGNPHLFVRPIAKSHLVQNQLRKSGRTLDSVPAVGEKVYLRSAANLSAGGDNIELTDHVHPSLKEIAVRAARVVPGSELAGVDMLLEDHTAPAGQQVVNVCEINGRPGISAHEFPMFGRPRPVAKAYVEHLASVAGLRLDRYESHADFEFSIHGRFNRSQAVNLLDEHTTRVGTSFKGLSWEDKTLLTFTITGSPLLAASLSSLLAMPISARVGIVEACQVLRAR